MEYTRFGRGAPLLLLHGLGGSRRSWDTIAGPLAAERDLVVVDLPGHGATPPLHGEASIATYADAVTAFMRAHDLIGAGVVGSSMGARLALELARRGVAGDTVALDPGGFWRGWEVSAFGASVALSARLVRALQPAMPVLTGNPVLRTVLFAQFSAHGWTVPGPIALQEMRSFAATPAFDALLDSLVHGPAQEGAIDTPGRVTIGWGRRDLVCFPTQAARASRAFPRAVLHWFDHSGHFPHWDAPEETVRVILGSTGAPVAPGSHVASAGRMSAAP